MQATKHARSARQANQIIAALKILNFPVTGVSAFGTWEDTADHETLEGPAPVEVCRNGSVVFTCPDTGGNYLVVPKHSDAFLRITFQVN